jgi:hypothetical protein
VHNIFSHIMSEYPNFQAHTDLMKEQMTHHLASRPRHPM